MKRCSPIVAALLLGLAPALWAQTDRDARKSAAQVTVQSKGQEGSIWVSFVPVPRGAPVRDVGGGQGTLDLGPVSYLTGAAREGVSVTRKGRSFVVETSFGVRAGNSEMAGTAKLIGLVTQVYPRARVYVDGTRLTLAPQVIQMAMKYGAVSEHRLQIELPTDTPETAARCFNSIAFQVLPN